MRWCDKVSVWSGELPDTWYQVSERYITGRRIVDKELLSEQVQVERKLFSFELRENLRGRFLKITEDVGGRRDTIIIPATGLDKISEILGHAIQASNDAGPCEADTPV
jgi:hypothetical protein